MICFLWKHFICNLLVVKGSMVEKHPEMVESLVHGAVRSGIWAEKHPNEAAEIAARYWNQSVELVRYALNTPENRIVYNQYIPNRAEMQQMADLMFKYGLTDTKDIGDLVEDRFARTADTGAVSNLSDILH